jgi:hypothetical protein
MDKEEIQEMINQSISKAMDKHNKTASLISACVGAVLLGFYAHGLLAVVGKIK